MDPRENLLPKRTTYRNINFKSRSKARWGVCFDEAYAEWMYEPETFDLGDGIFYKPDFLVKNVKCGEVDDFSNYGIPHEEILKKRKVIKNLWVEVKGVLDKFSAEKILKFIKQLPPDDGLIVLGGIPGWNEDWLYDQDNDYKYKTKHGVQFYALNNQDSGFADYLGVDETGGLILFHDYGWDGRVGLDSSKTKNAFETARNFGFGYYGEFD